VGLIRSDLSLEVQREAVETLGDLEGGRGIPFLKETAESHPRRDVRREALETMAEAAPPDEAMALLSKVAQQDQSVDIQRAAVEALGNIDDPAARRLLLEIAQQHPRYEVRMEAVETLGELEDPRVSAALEEIIRDHPRVEARVEAVQTVADHAEPEAAVRFLKPLAQGADRQEVRWEALEALDLIRRPR